ncbi:hypothetical protein THAOC_35924 [Thalassiosira oceanica]|uniref:Uncharacterized protein n=1 Tax=Thalassiosira oceanica TaxID=159749 RepID=K0R2M1_THAOC|nr:hypothetical protein THAOC_35924 [Thalassiosira oceanica]|eukprot:EJK45459.1 hypothetical protein THAOC_35924 [Thalassiosira oceanica]
MDDDEYSLDDFTKLSSIQESKVDDHEDDDIYTCFSEEQLQPADHGEEDAVACEEDDDVTGDGRGPSVQPCNDSELCGGRGTGSYVHKNETNENGLDEEEETKSSNTQENSIEAADSTMMGGANVRHEGDVGRGVERGVEDGTSFSSGADQEETKSSSEDTKIDPDSHEDDTGDMNTTMLGVEQERGTNRGRTNKAELRQFKPKIVKREPGFVPSCAYAQKGSRRKTKEGVEANESKIKPPRRYSRKRLEELSTPFRHFDNEKENVKNNQQLGRQEKTARQRKSMPSDERGFLERMDFFEKERKDKLEQAAHQFHYETSIKLRCRACGSYQTLEEKLANDLNCKSPTKFILAKFEARSQRSSMRRDLKMKMIEEERRSTLMDPKIARSKKQLELQAKVQSSQNGGSFEERMIRDLQRRKHRLAKLSVGKEGLSEEYTFQPKLKIDENLLTKRVGGIERLATPSARYTEPYCPPPEEERPMSSKRRRGRRKKPIESLWATNDSLRKRFNGPR